MSAGSRGSAAIAVNRFGLGARPGELARAADARAWLEAQLGGGPPGLADSTLQSSPETLAKAIELRRDAMKLPAYFRPLYVAEVESRLRAAVASDRPFIERLVHFWSNHFAVSVDKIAVLGIAGAFEREAIRPHVLGRFADLLLAVERHPAMLLYLDNHVSIGPGSRAAQRFNRRARARKLDINENLAREILELHTLGVGGGYTQADVTSFAKVITGWSIGGPFGRLEGGEPGKFFFRSELHEPGAKLVLGKRYAEEGYAQGAAVLADLARHRSTARFVATKLARHFIADEPPQAAIERIARAFLESDGDLPSVYRALIDSPEAWSNLRAKYKTPSDYLYSAWRGLEIPPLAGRAALLGFEVLGQRTWSPGSPAGWPDRSADWDGAAALMKRIEWADAAARRLGSTRRAASLAPELLGETLSDATRQAIARAADASQALTLLLVSPEFMWR